MRLFVVVLCGCCLMRFQVAADDGNLDVHAYLPLLESNSIARKVLDVTYSCSYEETSNGKVVDCGKNDVHLVFDSDTGNYREETKSYNNPNDDDKYKFTVAMWNGKEYVEWDRFLSKKQGILALWQQGGSAVVNGHPYRRIPLFVEFLYDAKSIPLGKSILRQYPKLGNLSVNTITIETVLYKFEISKKTGALERVISYNWDEDDEPFAGTTYDLSHHVERSGIWIPLRITRTVCYQKDKIKMEMTADPETLRLLDKVENPSIFSEQMPPGCVVTDDVRKKSYIVKTVDTLPNDVDAIQKMLEKMLEQADEQKAAIEEEIKAKKKKK